jgi:hypothetical protein
MFHDQRYNTWFLGVSALLTVVWLIRFLADNPRGDDWTMVWLLVTALIIVAPGIFIRNAPLRALGAIGSLPIFGMAIWCFFDTVRDRWDSPEWVDVPKILALTS